MKIYLKLEGAAEELIVAILKKATEETDNPDLRNRGYIYWRMLSTDPEGLKNIVLTEKPPISGDSFNFEGPLLEKLVANIGTLASVYSKPPEQFVKKIQDRVIERFDTEFIEEEIQNMDELDSAGQQKNYSAQDSKIEGFGDLLDLDTGDSTTPTHPVEEAKSVKSGIDELLSLGSPTPPA